MPKFRQVWYETSRFTFTRIVEAECAEEAHFMDAVERDDEDVVEDMDFYQLELVGVEVVAEDAEVSKGAETQEGQEQ